MKIRFLERIFPLKKYITNFSLLWIFSWFLKALTWAKCFPHSLHLSFKLLCLWTLLIWIWSFLPPTKTFWQRSHLLSSWNDLIWLVSLTFDCNFLLHILHSNIFSFDKGSVSISTEKESERNESFCPKNCSFSQPKHPVLKIILLRCKL